MNNKRIIIITAIILTSVALIGSAMYFAAKNDNIEVAETSGKDNKVVETANTDTIMEQLQAGNFSAFAGTYTSTSESNDAMGGGRDLNELELRNDGSLIGGGSYYSENFYPTSAPTTIEQNEDGSYLCKWSETAYYVIYPIGTIEDREYVKTNQSYLKDTVYIHCTVFDGGVLDVTYYLNGTKLTVSEYEGVDWVSTDDFTNEIGSTLVSGTGVEYTVVDVEQNLDSGRERVVLLMQDGAKRMIGNIPAFLLDSTTGITYYNISDYESDANYS